MKKRFGVLKLLATILKVLGVVVAAFAVLGGLGTLIISLAGGDLMAAFGVDSGSGIFMGLVGSLGIVVFGFLYAIILYGYGELLLVLLSMEDNTYKTVKLLEDVIKDE
mgnify:CR=1 FL=1|jgi:hypothetical protein